MAPSRRMGATPNCVKSKRSPDGAERNPGQRLGPAFRPLHPGYALCRSQPCPKNAKYTTANSTITAVSPIVST